MATLDGDEILRRYREQRVVTMALADQVDDEHWREPRLPGARSLHDLLSHVLAWDEWSIAIFELSALRPLPETLTRSPREVDAFNERAVRRYKGLSRDDLLSGLQMAVDRVILAARSVGREAWAERRIADLARRTIEADGAEASNQQDARAPRVGRMVQQLTYHEQTHDAEIMAAYGIEPRLEQFEEEADAGDGTANT